MDIEKLFGKNLPPAVTELLALLLSEWMTILNRKQEKEYPQKYKEYDACFDNWEKMIKENCPELEKKNRDFLDFLVGYYGNELESYYLLGLRDGIRVYHWVLHL